MREHILDVSHDRIDEHCFWTIFVGGGKEREEVKEDVDVAGSDGSLPLWSPAHAGSAQRR